MLKIFRKYTKVTIWFVVDGEAVFLATMNMQRQWTRNGRIYLANRWNI